MQRLGNICDVNGLFILQGGIRHTYIRHNVNHILKGEKWALFQDEEWFIYLNYILILDHDELAFMQTIQIHAHFSIMLK